eukprot:124003-Chlamydomonas_euryale.AAC.1
MGILVQEYRSLGSAMGSYAAANYLFGGQADQLSEAHMGRDKALVTQHGSIWDHLAAASEPSYVKSLSCIPASHRHAACQRVMRLTTSMQLGRA